MMRGPTQVSPGIHRVYEWWVGLLAFTFALLLAGCAAAMESDAKAASAPQAAQGHAMGGMPTSEAAPAPMAPGDGGADTASGNFLGAQQPPPSGAAPTEPTTGAPPVLASDEKPAPLLIYRATLTLAVFETKKVMDGIEGLAKAMGGYLVARDDMAITIRVPASKFDTALGDIAKQGDELHRQVEVSDVTEQFNDLNIELKNAEVVRERLVALLEKAQKVEEALAVEAELARLTDKIERIKGRLKLLKELVAFSTVTVRFEARPVERLESNVQLPFPWLKQLGLGELLSL